MKNRFCCKLLLKKSGQILVIFIQNYVKNKMLWMYACRQTPQHFYLKSASFRILKQRFWNSLNLLLADVINVCPFNMVRNDSSVKE